MKTHYRVIKDNFLWEVGAIISSEGGGGYRPETDLWDKTKYNETEYISTRIVENNPEFFERVYEVNLINKVVYRTKAQYKEFVNDQFKQ